MQASKPRAPIPLPEHTRRAFLDAVETMNRAGIPYAIGGAFAVHHYSGMWRNTDDLDLYIRHSDLPAAAHALCEIKFRDYGEMAAGDREWIYHAIRDGVLIDLIWQAPNRLATLERDVVQRAVDGEFLGVPTRFLPADALIWAKVFTMNRQRCDWPDLFSVVRACPKELDWQYLVDKMGEHWPVLLAFIIIFDWVHPAEAPCVPKSVREELLHRKMHQPLVEAPTRESLLDPWIYTRPSTP